MRTATSLDSYLSGDLLATYRSELADVRTFLGRQEGERARRRAARAMRNLFCRHYGLDDPEAGALARLAIEMPPLAEATPAIAALAQRVALQRALVREGHGRELAPYYRAAARGALEGFAIDSDQVLALTDPEVRGGHIPTLPPLHSQSSSIEDAEGSSLFEEPGP